MANDINKKITIEVELETEKLIQNINSLNSVIDGLLAKQQQLNTAGQQNTAAFNAVTTQLEAFQKKLQEVNTQITTNTSSLNALTAAGKTLDSALSSTTSQHQKNAKAAGDSSAKMKELTSQINSVSKSAKQQQGSSDKSKKSLDAFSGSSAKGAANAKKLHTNINAASTAFNQSASTANKSKSSFDAHKLTMDHLKTSFDELKSVSRSFGPTLQDAAQGFSAMKNGLSILKGGLDGIGTAIKADGFGLLLDILQQIFDAFVKSPEGTRIITSALAAIGVVVNKIKTFFTDFLNAAVNAVSHPVESIKALGKAIEQNIVNRFKAFGVILDGIIHLDFKKMANGAIQAFTGVTDATDKIGTAFTAVKKGVEDTAGQMVSTYKKSYEQAGKYVDDHVKVVKQSLETMAKAQEDYEKKIHPGNKGKTKQAEPKTRGESLDMKSVGLPPDTPDNSPKAADPIFATKIPDTQKTEDQVVQIKKTALQQVEEYAKQSGVKMANDAINTLSSSIKQQSDAKVAALEKDKAAELSKSNLTSAQKIGIEQKYKQQENKIKAKAFKEEQELSIAQAIINGAEAVTKVTAQSGLLAALSIGVVIAGTAAQVAKIASQKPPAYAKGGLHYSSDGRGGVLSGYSKTDNTNAYLRSGEGIVVSEAMRVPWARNLVSAINVGFGGRDFSMANPGHGYAVGGIFTDGGEANRYYNQPIHDQKNLANTIAYQMINNFPPVYVDVKDVNNQQNILAQTINRVNL